MFLIAWLPPIATLCVCVHYNIKIIVHTIKKNKVSNKWETLLLSLLVMWSAKLHNHSMQHTSNIKYLLSDPDRFVWYTCSEDNIVSSLAGIN